MHPTTLHYVGTRKFGERKGKKHYHLMLPVNRDTWCRAGDYRTSESLTEMTKQAGCNTLGMDVGRHATLMHPPAGPAVRLMRNDDTGFQQVLERVDYLIKEHTKTHCIDGRSFGCSRSGARLARQYPANQEYGLLPDGNDVPARPLTVSYVGAPLRDNHSAVVVTGLLYLNSSPGFDGTAIYTLTMLPMPGRLLPACRLAAEVYDYVREIFYRFGRQWTSDGRPYCASHTLC